MLERHGQSAFAANRTTSTGRETPGAKFQKPHFPETFGEYLEETRKRGVANLAFDILDAGQDANEAYWARKKLAWEKATPDFYSEDKVSKGNEPVIVLGGGFTTWRGSELLRDSVAGRDSLSSGVYSPVTKYFEDKGVKVIEAWPKSGIITADIDANMEALCEAVDRADSMTDGPVGLVGHSMSGELSYLMAARHPDVAKKVDVIITGGAPIPYHVNSVVEAMVLFSPNNRANHKLIEEAIEHQNSPQAQDSRFVAIAPRYDRIIRGPSPGEVHHTERGHSSIFFDKDTLDMISHTVKTSRVDDSPKTPQNPLRPAA